MREYVAGFAFDQLTDEVLLIEKLKPAWQKGKLNGVGGKIEPGETPEYAMRREFREEAGIDVPEGSWIHAVTLQGPDYVVYFFRATLLRINYVQMTDEKLVLVDSVVLPQNVIYNLRWLIPLVRDKSIAFPLVVNDAIAAADSTGTNK